MLQYLAVLSALALLQASSHAIGNEVIPDHRLVMAFVVNRHGERTPDEDELSLSNQKARLKNLTYIDGLEGLTNTGKRRAYQIGKFLRQRYGSQGHDVLSSLYLQDEILVRSTDKERTKMTALVAMAAAYPPEIEQQWDEGIGKVWQPIPYSTVPLSEDYLRYNSNCQNYKNFMTAVKKEAFDGEFAQFKDLLPLLKTETGRNFTENPVLFQTLYDLFKSQLGLGLDIPEWSKPVLPRLSRAALLAYRLFFKTDEMKKYGGGVLLHKFLRAAEAAASGEKVKKVYMFSAHDYNVGGLMAVANVEGEENIMPAYGAVFALELYKSNTGEYSVLPVYLEQAGQSIATPMRIKNCTEPSCDLHTFKQLTKNFIFPEPEFHDACATKLNVDS